MSGLTYGAYTSDPVEKVTTRHLVHTGTGATVGFYGVTPIARRSGSAQATFTITIGTSQTGWGFKTSDQFNAFVLQMREIQDTFIALGLWTGS